jgi:hypothetical protein
MRYILNVKVQTEGIEYGSSEIKWATRKIAVAMTPDAITMRQWSDFWLMKATLPEKFNALDGMTEMQRNAEFAEFTDADWAMFAASALQLLTCMVDDADKAFMQNLPIFSTSDNSILALYFTILSAVVNYQPVYRETFTFKGYTFLFPKKTADTMQRMWFGDELTAGEALEALQCAHILNQKDENGNYVLDDRKYHTDVALLATLARKINPDGLVEKVPVETLAMRQFYENRIEFFKDAPMSVALDMSFFFKSSKIAYTNTLTSPSLTNRLRQTLTTQNESGKMAKSGKFGGGKL